MHTARRISQLFFLLLFFVLFLEAAYPLHSFLPVDFFLRIDPLIGLTGSIAARTLILKAAPAVLMMVLAVVLGRFFCGWICPLGTMIDGSDRLLKSRSVSKKHTFLFWPKFSLLVIILLTSIFSVQLAGLMDPIALATRTSAVFIYPVFSFFTDGWIGFLLSLGVMEDALYGFHEWLTGFLLPIRLMTFQGSILISLIFILIIGLGLVHRRYWCRNLCPLGALYGLFSKWRLYRRKVSDACTSCGLCRKNCRMDAISKDFVSTNNLECIDCMDCQKICPEGAIRFGFVKKPDASRLDYGRRRLLHAGAAGFLTMGMLQAGFRDPKNQGKVVRPPGSLPEPEFLDRCVRCGECVRICSTAGAGLQHSALESGWSGIWTPHLYAKAGYCEYNCNLCGQVCPTGAIHPLELEEKQNIKMGTSHFDKTRCIPWYYGENCLVCEEHCPLPEKAIKLREKNLTTIDGRIQQVLLPYVDEELCIGCGICVTRCPVEGDKGIFLTNADEERWTG